MPAWPIEDRIALEDCMIAYCYAVDDLEDVEALLDQFTDDAVLDFSGIGLPTMHGKDAFRKFYETVFADMSDHTHYLTNFRVEDYQGDRATTSAYVEGLGRAKDGNEVHVHVRYKMDFEKRADRWICTKYWIYTGMPLPGSLDTMHGDH